MNVEDGRDPVANSLPVHPVISIEDNLYQNNLIIAVRSIRVTHYFMCALLEYLVMDLSPTFH